MDLFDPGELELGGKENFWPGLPCGALDSTAHSALGVVVVFLSVLREGGTDLYWTLEAWR